MIAILLQALAVTLVDIDNAMYTTDQVSGLREHKRTVTVLVLLLEFAGRLLLLLLFTAVAGAREPLFIIAGIPVRLDHLALLAAGLFLVISNGRELLHQVREPALAAVKTSKPPRSFALHIAEMGLILTLLSVDTVLAVMNVTTVLAEILFFFLFSAALRLLFVDRLVALIERFPAITVFINSLLILIGFELVLQGLEIDFEREFNAFVLLAIIAITIYVWYTTRKISVQ